MREDLYTAYYAVSGNEEIVADRDVEIPGMEEDMLVERTAGAVVESERNVVVMNQPANSHNDGNGQEEQINVAGKQQLDLEGTEMSKIHNLSDENVTRIDEGITDVTGKSELVEHEEKSLWTKLDGLSGEYQILVALRMSVILLRQMYSDLILLM